MEGRRDRVPMMPMNRAVDIPIEVRSYEDADEPAVLELLRTTLGPGPGGWRSPEFFRWKHERNPFGRSFMLVAEVGERIVGFRAFMRWGFEAGDRIIRAVRAVDTATHPEFQRMGVFSRLTKRALEDLRGQTDLVFNTPNTRSGPGYLKLGWKQVGRVGASVRVRRPLRFLRGLRSARTGGRRAPGPRILVDAEPAGKALADGVAVSSLLSHASAPEHRLTTPMDLAFLRWRYGDAPLLDYRAVREESAGRLSGLAILRIRPRGMLWQCSVAEVIVERGDIRTAKRLLRRAVVAAPVDFVVFRMPSGSTPARAAARTGFLPTSGSQTLVVNPLGEGLRPDPEDPRSWALSLGDLEVF
jgi:GNAT superfamily N-acetyltransferase